MCNEVFNDGVYDFILQCLYCCFFDNVKFLIMIKLTNSNSGINETTQKWMHVNL